MNHLWKLKNNPKLKPILCKERVTEILMLSIIKIISVIMYKNKEEKKGKATFCVKDFEFLLDSHEIMEKMWLDLPLPCIICSCYR